MLTDTEKMGRARQAVILLGIDKDQADKLTRPELVKMYDRLELDAIDAMCGVERKTR